MDNHLASWLSSSSWERRRAWAKPSVAVEEEGYHAVEEASHTPQGAHEPPFLEDGISQAGSSSDKIESWLQKCSSSVDPFLESISALGPKSGSCSNRTSFEDDLSLGAEATELLGKDRAEPRAQKHTSWPSHHLNLDHSMTSSAISGSTNKTSSSISEVLELREADAETILCNLGFVQEETQAAPWIPSRFFSVPSQAEGIDFQLFLRAQVQRLEMEDPCLILASRFKQVQTLAVTADAFFCLYSYVSKTPIQKICPAHLFGDFPDTPDSWAAPSSSESLPPLKRLQKAISRMCLYTSTRGGPQGPSPGQSSMSRLERVVWEVMEKAHRDKLHFDVEASRKGEPCTPLSKVTFPHGEMGSDSSECTRVESTPMNSSHCCPEATSHSKWEPWLSHCRGGESMDGPDRLGHQEQHCYGHHSLEVVSSPEESSEESLGEWSAERDSPQERGEMYGHLEKVGVAC